MNDATNGLGLQPTEEEATQEPSGESRDETTTSDAPPAPKRKRPSGATAEPPPPPSTPPPPPPRPAAARAATTAPDPFDPASLALGQDFAGDIGVKKLTTTVPVRKPHRHEWVCVHPDEGYRLQTAALAVKFEREEIYLVAQHLWSELPGEIRPIEILTAINREGVVFLWPLKLPGPDGRLDTWSASAIDAAGYARQGWVRVTANMALGAYEVHVPTGELSAPAWSTLSLRELLRIAFRDRFIDSLDHPVLKRLRGEV